MAKRFWFLKGYKNSSVLPLLCNRQNKIHWLTVHRQKDCSYRTTRQLASMWPELTHDCKIKCKRGQTWTILHSRRFNHIRSMKNSETGGGSCIFVGKTQRKRILFHSERKLSECRAHIVTVKGRERAYLSTYQSSLFVVRSQRLLAMFLWRPLAGRESGTVLCADVDQALAGFEASQRFATRKGDQGSTQAHHGGGVVLFWKPGT